MLGLVETSASGIGLGLCSEGIYPESKVSSTNAWGNANFNTATEDRKVPF